MRVGEPECAVGSGNDPLRLMNPGVSVNGYLPTGSNTTDRGTAVIPPVDEPERAIGTRGDVNGPVDSFGFVDRHCSGRGDPSNRVSKIREPHVPIRPEGNCLRFAPVRVVVGDHAVGVHSPDRVITEI